jgi:hypothetical protein
MGLRFGIALPTVKAIRRAKVRSVAKIVNFILKFYDLDVGGEVGWKDIFCWETWGKNVVIWLRVAVLGLKRPCRCMRLGLARLNFDLVEFVGLVVESARSMHAQLGRVNRQLEI